MKKKEIYSRHMAEKEKKIGSFALIAFVLLVAFIILSTLTTGRYPIENTNSPSRPKSESTNVVSPGIGKRQLVEVRIRPVFSSEPIPEDKLQEILNKK